MSLKDIAAVAANMSRTKQQDSVVVAKAGKTYLVNSDRTMLVRFDGVDEAGEEIGWRARDWEQGEISTEGDATVFRWKSGGCSRTKRVPRPPIRFTDADEAWKRLEEMVDEGSPKFAMDSYAFQEIDEDLSHVEFWWRDGRVVIKQRDLYSGGLVEIELPSKKGFFAQTPAEFDRSAMRTKDLVSLFLIGGELTILLSPSVTAVDLDRGGRAMVGNCVYDEMYELKEAGSGRKEP